MKIKTVSIIGLGALGILFGHHLAKRMPPGNLRVIADPDRVKRYKTESLHCNDERCEFHYVAPDERCDPADLVLFTVKFNDLNAAIPAVKNQIGEQTLILSALNGISSEEMIGQAYGMDKLLYCVAQGMDAVKVGNKLTYDHMGMLVFGDREPGVLSSKVRRVANFFDSMEIPYEAVTDMNHRLWGKFMLNVGVNQTVAVYEGNYGDILREGPARETMLAAMKEVLPLSREEGVPLTESDLNYWLNVLKGLSPEGKPSMRQDMEAKRPSEVELFSGTVLKLGKKHGIPTPVNAELYRRITSIESQY